MHSRKILLTLECGGVMSSLTVAVNLTVDSAVRSITFNGTTFWYIRKLIAEGLYSSLTEY